MTRDEAISKVKGYLTDYLPSDDYEEVEEIIKALEQESSYNSVNSLVESKLKNPKAKTFDILDFVADNAGLSTFEAIEKAYNMGVSEQKAVLDKVRAEIREWYWQADKQALAKDPCVVDAMIDLFIRTINKYKAESEDT